MRAYMHIGWNKGLVDLTIRRHRETPQGGGRDLKNKRNHPYAILGQAIKHWSITVFFSFLGCRSSELNLTWASSTATSMRTALLLG